MAKSGVMIYIPPLSSVANIEKKVKLHSLHLGKYNRRETYRLHRCKI